MVQCVCEFWIRRSILLRDRPSLDCERGGFQSSLYSSFYSPFGNCSNTTRAGDQLGDLPPPPPPTPKRNIIKLKSCVGTFFSPRHPPSIDSGSQSAKPSRSLVFLFALDTPLHALSSLPILHCQFFSCLSSSSWSLSLFGRSITASNRLHSASHTGTVRREESALLLLLPFHHNIIDGLICKPNIVQPTKDQDRAHAFSLLLLNQPQYVWWWWDVFNKSTLFFFSCNESNCEASHVLAHIFYSLNCPSILVFFSLVAPKF